jgi:hypothetical protein
LVLTYFAAGVCVDGLTVLVRIVGILHGTYLLKGVVSWQDGTLSPKFRDCLTRPGSCPALGALLRKAATVINSLGVPLRCNVDSRGVLGG